MENRAPEINVDQQKRVKVGVFLGYNLALKMDDIKRDWELDESNDPAPYGYNWANSNQMSIEYIRLNSVERRIPSRYAQIAYLYCLKLPFLMLTRFDIMWTHYDKDALFIASLRRLPLIGKLFARQISCFIWLIDRYETMSSKSKIRTTKLLKVIDTIVYHAKSETELFVKYFDCDPLKLKYTTFGINFEAYSLDSKNRRPPDLPSVQKGFVLSVGTDRHRDYNCLLAMAAQMKEINFVWATSNKDFMKVPAPRNLTIISTDLLGIRWLYANCSFVIIPLKHNEHVSGCTTLLEAAAMKKPVILSSVPGIDAYLINGETGITVPVGDDKAFLQAIKTLLSDSDLARRLGEQAYKHCSKKNTSKNWAQAHVEITKEIMR